MENSRFAFATTARHFGRSLLWVAAIAGALSISARADLVLVPAVAFAQCSVTGLPIETDPERCSAGTVNTHATAGIFLSRDTVIADASSSGVALPSSVQRAAGAHGQLQYSFQVTGGTPGDIVPLDFALALSASSSNSDRDRSRAFAAITVHTGVVGTVTLKHFDTADLAGGSFSGILTFSETSKSHIQATSGAIGDFLFLEADAFASGRNETPELSATTEFAEATADPFIFVDPDFPNASLYSIVVSPGVSNAPIAAVPEPATPALVGAALGALGLLRRQRRSVTDLLGPPGSSGRLHPRS